jgi:hypothetical protein
MRNYQLSTLLGLTTTVAVCVPLPVQAATFNFPNLPLQPIDSEYRLETSGDPSTNQGVAAFSNLDPSALDYGHRDISLNAGGFGAAYYLSGRPGSPEDPPSGATRASTVNEVVGFPTLSSYLTSNGILPGSIGFSFNIRSGRSFTETWNLGDDVLGEDWFASPDSTLEERIYTAEPDDVEIFISYGTTKILELGYTDLYYTIDYGSTTSVSDDFEVNFGAPTKPTKLSGLEPFVDALADAFLEDVADAGGSVQIVYADNPIIDETNFKTGNGFGTFLFSFPVSIRAVDSVAVPEPSSALGLLMFGALGAVSYLKKQKNKRGSSI